MIKQQLGGKKIWKAELWLKRPRLQQQRRKMRKTKKKRREKSNTA